MAPFKKTDILRKYKAILVAIVFVVSIISCKNPADKAREANERVLIEMKTNKGIILLELYNETPKHRDNFVKLANEKAFDSLLFHRMIENFMIQGGDPDSKYAGPNDTLGNGDKDYRVEAEFRPDLFHKKGALAAARDANPKRASSAMQFYIVQGKVFNDSTLNLAEERINNYLASHYARAENPELSLLLEEAMNNNDWESYGKYNDSLIKYGREMETFELNRIPEAHREVYKTIGGAPHLDQSYTVFGEVIEGLEVVDSIAAAETNPLDRPIHDVRILSIRVMD
jgi:cyclophilin family peptidyl-prolyl cis-trans isomerase